MQKNLDSFLPILLENAHRHLNQLLTQALAAEGMQPDYWRVLFVLGDEKGRTMGDLAESLGMNPPKVSKLMDKMVSKGLVLRNADGQDSRRVLAYITDNPVPDTLQFYDYDHINSVFKGQAGWPDEDEDERSDDAAECDRQGRLQLQQC